MTSTTRRSAFSFSRAAFGGLAFLTVAAISAPASANDCNPITFLFGGCHQESIRPAPAPLSLQPIAAGPRHHAMAPQRRHAPAARALARNISTHTTESARATTPPRSSRASALNEMRQAPRGSLAQFAADPTLRAGDIVVTSEGFRVYRDRRFSPIAGGGALAALEMASMRAPTTDYASPIAAARADGHGLLALRKAIRVALNQ